MCVQKEISLPDIAKLAEATCRASHGPRIKKETKRILNLRLQDKDREIKAIKLEWMRASQNVGSINFSYRARCYYKDIKITDISKVWSKEKGRISDKVARMLVRGREAKGRTYDTLYGIKISDKLLIQKFGSEKPKPAIYGGIEATEEMKEFLRLSSKFRLYNNVNIVNKEVSS